MLANILKSWILIFGVFYHDMAIQLADLALKSDIKAAYFDFVQIALAHMAYPNESVEMNIIKNRLHLSRFASSKEENCLLILRLHGAETPIYKRM